MLVKRVQIVFPCRIENGVKAIFSRKKLSPRNPKTISERTKTATFRIISLFVTFKSPKKEVLLGIV
jgi:hypothetical protein